MLTITNAQSYISNIKATQSSEQMKSMELRQRGINFEQQVSTFCPQFMYILEINQFYQVISDDKRDKMIDYLINI